MSQRIRFSVEVFVDDQDLGSRDSSYPNEVSTLKEENRRLRAEAAAEIKQLQNKVLIAEEKSKAFLDQYSNIVAPLEIKKEFWRRELEDPPVSKVSPPYMFDLPLSSNVSTNYNNQTYHLDTSKYRDNYFERPSLEPPRYSTNLYGSQPIKRYIDREPSPIYAPVYEPPSQPVNYQSYVNRSFQEHDRPQRLASPTPNIRSYLDTEVNKSRDTSRGYLSRHRHAGTLRNSAISVGDDYLGKLSSVYPSSTNQLNASFDRGSLRRKAVAEASSTKTRPGESFLNEFRQKMQAINL